MSALCFLLGSWQVQRYFYKERIIHNLAKEATFLPDVVSKGIEYRKVYLKPTGFHEKKFFMFAGNNNFELVVPVTYNEKNILAKLGKVTSKDVKLDNDYNNTYLEGIVVFPKKIPLIKNDVENNLWFNYDFKLMSKASGVELENYIINLLNISSDSNITQNTIPDLKNIHLKYVIFWYFLFFFSLFMVFYKSYTR